MKIGVPKEIKPQENRIGLTPQSVKTLTSNGHVVLVEKDGGFEAGFDNDQYKKSINPGYTAIGRMMGLSELRGIIKAVS